MKIMVAILFLFALTMPCFVSSLSAQQPTPTATKSAKKKTGIRPNRGEETAMFAKP